MEAPALSPRQWRRIQEHLPGREPSRKGGRPRADDRACFEGILWVLWTGSGWCSLPRRYGSPATCWRRHADWSRQGALARMLRAYLEGLPEESGARPGWRAWSAKTVHFVCVNRRAAYGGEHENA